MPIHIEEDELIVGSAGLPGQYAIFCPEFEDALYAENLQPSKPGDRFVVTEEDLRIVNEEMKPYWDGKRFDRKALFQALPEDTLRLIEIFAVITPSSPARSNSGYNHDYAKVLNKGISHIRKQAQKTLSALDPMDPADRVEKEPFLRSAIIVCDAMVRFARRYAALADDMAKGELNAVRKKELEQIAEICQWVPEKPARTFREAVQSQWFVQTVSRLEQRMGGIVGNGRIDQYLYPYYKKDTEEKRITDNEVMELLECLWIGMAKNKEIYTSPGTISYSDGNAHWEATTLGGRTRDGVDATNELSYLILQSKREFPLDYPDLAVRIHSNTPDSFLYAVCETIKDGTGFPKLFFDEEIIPLYLAKGATMEEANDYAASSCAEVKIDNKDLQSTGDPMINLGAILEMTLNNGRLKLFGNQHYGVNTGDARNFRSSDELFDAFCKQLENVLKHTFTQQYIAEQQKSRYLACPMFSMLHDVCLKNCKDLHSGHQEGGIYIEYINMIGMATAIDSLAAIKNLVFDEKKLTMAELLEALDTDFKGNEVIRQLCLNAPKFGNSIAWVDLIGHDIETFLVKTVRRYKTAFGAELNVIHVPVTAHIPYGAISGATPNGRKAGEPLSEGISPSQGADRQGPTAVLASVARTRCGIYKERGDRLLNIKLSPSAVAGPEGTKKLMSLIRTASDLKMWHLQFNIINKETLIAAQKNPEKYQNLMVRVAGFSAYFVDLSPQLQNEIIQRTEHTFQ